MQFCSEFNYKTVLKQIEGITFFVIVLHGPPQGLQWPLADPLPVQSLNPPEKGSQKAVKGG